MNFGVMLGKKLQSLVDGYLRDNRNIGGNVNWADVRCVSVGRVECLLTGAQSLRVVVSGADDRDLEKRIAAHLKDSGFNVEVVTKW